tara:strand:- start:727 stop:1245 length:519 start_codon:yes stop_codon:yes gene_type:complete
MPILIQKKIREYTSGLYYRRYTGYKATPSDLAGLQGDTGTSTNISSFSVATTTTYVFRGLFLPDATSSSWQFRTTSDDGSYLWIGSNSQAADDSLSTGDVVVNNGGLHSEQTVTSGNISLTEKIYYPFAVFTNNNTGPGTLTVEFRKNSGSWTSNGDGFYFYDSGTDNGYNL